VDRPSPRSPGRSFRDGERAEVNDAESNAGTLETNSARQGKRVRGSPIIGNALDKARDPARFILRYYREHGPVVSHQAVQCRLHCAGRGRSAIAHEMCCASKNHKSARSCLTLSDSVTKSIRAEFSIQIRYRQVKSHLSVEHVLEGPPVAPTDAQAAGGRATGYRFIC
jgi:hypothetical protein